MFNFKKKKNEKVMDESINSFNELWNTNINEIWEIQDKNSFVVAMNGWVSKKCDYGLNMDSLSAQERIFYIVKNLEDEIYNGGFSQYLYNTGGEFIFELTNAFTAIGAEITANIYKKVIEACDINVSLTRSEREKFFSEMIDDKIDAIFDESDIRFYEELDDLEDLCYHFIIKNKKHFS